MSLCVWLAVVGVVDLLRAARDATSRSRRALLVVIGVALLVLAGPGPGTTEAFGVTDPPYSVRVPSPRAADCADARFAGLSLEVDRALEYPGAGDGCFRGPCLDARDAG